MAKTGPERNLLSNAIHESLKNMTASLILNAGYVISPLAREISDIA